MVLIDQEDHAHVVDDELKIVCFELVILLVIDFLLDFAKNAW